MRSTLLAACLLAPLVGACEPRGADATALPREDVAALEDLVESYRLAALAGEWEAIAELYTSEGMRNPPNAEAVQVSPDELEVAYGGLEEFENPPEEIDGWGDLAYVRGTYTVRVRRAAPGGGSDEPAEGGEAAEGEPALAEDTGDYLALMRKQGDGRWRIAYLMSNSDRPPPAPAPAPED